MVPIDYFDAGLPQNFHFVEHYNALHNKMRYTSTVKLLKTKDPPKKTLKKVTLKIDSSIEILKIQNVFQYIV